MNRRYKNLVLLAMICLIFNCEGGQDETPSGYVISSLYEVDGKKRTDLTGEITSCRVDEVWAFDLARKQVTNDYIQGRCGAFTKKNSLTQPCDTFYVDSLKGNYLALSGAALGGTASPAVHPQFPMQLNSYQRANKLYTLFYRLIKFDRDELIILNQFNAQQIPRDTQYFEMTMKYVEQ